MNRKEVNRAGSSGKEGGGQDMETWTGRQGTGREKLTGRKGTRQGVVDRKAGNRAGSS